MLFGLTHGSDDINLLVTDGSPAPEKTQDMPTADLAFFSPSSFQGFKIDINCKQLTVDFVNQSVLQISTQDVESKRSDKTDFAEQLGAMNKSWQILQGLVAEKVSHVAPAAVFHEDSKKR